MPSKIISVHKLCPESDFENPNDLINLGIIVDILIRDIDCKIYKKGSEEDEYLRKFDPLVLIARAYSSEIELYLKQTQRKDDHFSAKVTLEEKFKFAPSEFIYKHMKENGINIDPDKLSELMIHFRNYGLARDVEDLVIDFELNTTRKELKQQPKYYHKLGNAFFNWNKKDQNHKPLINILRQKYKEEEKYMKALNAFDNPTLVKILKASLMYHAEKRIFAGLTQEAINTNAHKYIELFKVLFTDKEGTPDTQKNNLLKAQVCAAASFYEKNIGQYKDLIRQEYPNLSNNEIITLDNYGSTLVIEAIKRSYKGQHGLVPNVGRTIKMNSFSNLRRALINLETEKILAHGGRSIDLPSKTTIDSINKVGGVIGVNYVLKFIDRRFLTQGEDLIDYLIEETRKNSANALAKTKIKLNGNNNYTYELMKQRWEYYNDVYQITQMFHTTLTLDCPKITQ